MRDAGAFDGPLGVLAAVACVERLRAEGAALPFAIEVLGFSDEEGLRYGTAYLGSRAVAGSFEPALLDLVDDDGVTLGDALRAFGGAPEDVAWRLAARRAAARLLRGPHRAGAGARGPRRAGRRGQRDRRGHAGASSSFAGAPGTPARCRWTRATTRACAARRVGAGGRGGGARRAGAGGDRRPAGGAARARRTSCPARPSPRSTCATPTTRCARRRWRRCAPRRGGSAPARGVEVAWREVMSAPAVAADAALTAALSPRRWPSAGCRW